MDKRVENHSVLVLYVKITALGIYENSDEHDTQMRSSLGIREDDTLGWVTRIISPYLVTFLRTV